jgi:hypothetical protein
MNMGAYLFTSHTAHYYRSIVRERSVGYAKSSRSPGGENAQLRPAIEQCVDPAAVKLHRKEQMVATRPARGPGLGLGLGPSRRCTWRGLSLVKHQAVMRQVEIDVEVAQHVRTEHTVERSEENPRRIDRSDEDPSPWYCRAAHLKLRSSTSFVRKVPPPNPPIGLWNSMRGGCAPIRWAAAGVRIIEAAPVSRRRVTGFPLASKIVRRQGFWDNGLGKIREALAHRFGEVRRRAADAASDGWRWSVV